MIRSNLFSFLLILILLFACGRITKPIRPKGVPATAERDRRTKIWTYQGEDGAFRQYFPNGVLFMKGQKKRHPLLKNWIRTGEWLTYAMNGKTVTARGVYVDNRKDGVWDYNDDTGKLYLRMRYKPEPSHPIILMHADYGNENGPYERYFPDGSLEERGVYVGGSYEGRKIRYYQSGKPAVIGFYKKHKKIGKWLYYYPEGNLEREESYREGSLDGKLKNYRPDGSLSQIKTFVMGREKGETQLFDPPAGSRR